LARVLGRYGLVELRSIQRIEQGFVDENWCVETDRGRYFLKRRHPRRRQSEALVRAQHNLIRYLRGAGFPAPTLVPALSGETFVLLEGDLYELEEYIEGQPYDPGRPAHLVAAAQGLGRYHSCVEGFAPGALRARGVLYGPGISRAILQRLSESWQLGRDPALAAIDWKLAAREAKVANWFAQHGALTWLVIHGDYYAGNLIFEGDRIVALVDYDKASWQPRVAEVAEALIYFASSRPGHLEHLVYPGFLEWDPLSRFLQAYGETITLSEDELRALPDYVCSIWFSVSLRRLLEASPHRPPEAQAALAEVLALVNWVFAHTRQIVEVARAAMAREFL
jgi:homoserine kinase type II